jgi:hypothetical protein
MPVASLQLPTMKACRVCDASGILFRVAELSIGPIFRSVLHLAKRGVPQERPRGITSKLSPLPLAVHRWRYTGNPGCSVASIDPPRQHALRL